MWNFAQGWADPADSVLAGASWQVRVAPNRIGGSGP